LSANGYCWSRRKFFAAVLFTCKRFDTAAAIAFTQEYFAARDIKHRGF